MVLMSNTGMSSVADAGGVGRQIRTLQYHGADVGVLLQTFADHTHHLVGDSLQVELLVGMGVDTPPLRLVVEAQDHHRDWLQWCPCWRP